MASATPRYDILLVYLPLAGMIRLPVGLLSIATWLSRHGVRVRVLDMRLYSHNVACNLLARLVEESAAVGFSVMTSQAGMFAQVTDALKDAGLLTGRRIFAGGPHAALFPEQFDGRAEVCTEEGESFLGSVFGIPAAFNLYALGVQDYSLVETETYAVLNENWGAKTRSGRGLAVATARGCNGCCAFCINTALPWGRPWRARPAEAVLLEVRQLRSAYGVRNVNFEDEHFLGDPLRARVLAKGMWGDVRWSAALRVCDVVRDPELVREMAAAGMVEVNIGIEAGRDETLARLHKPHTVDQAREAARILAEAGVYALYSYIVGIPGEPPETDRATLALAGEIQRIHPASRVSGPQRYRAFPGTELALEWGGTWPKRLEDWPAFCEAHGGQW
jgi:hypothetical protein